MSADKRGRTVVVLLGLILALIGTVMVVYFTPTMQVVIAQRPELNGGGVADAVEAIQRARVVTRILYVTAHPDDEGGSVGLMAYLSRGLGADVALLSITRGEGGQNAIGPEYGPKLAVLRSEELLAACRQYGVKLFFTRAPDFGFSKTPEETMKVWGDALRLRSGQAGPTAGEGVLALRLRSGQAGPAAGEGALRLRSLRLRSGQAGPTAGEGVLADMVEVISEFQPHIIINNWAGVRTGHGHHVAAGLLTLRALEELRKTDNPWWKNVVLLNVWRGNNPPAGAVAVPSDQISPLRGKSYNEIGLEGFVNHRTQGIVGFRGSPFFRGARSLVPAAGEREITVAELAQPLTKLAPGNENLVRADQELAEAREAALRLDWGEAVRALVSAAHHVSELMNPKDPEAMADSIIAVRRIQDALPLAAGLQIRAQADRSEIVAGQSFTVRVEWQYRREISVEVERVELDLPEGWSIAKEEKEREGSVRFTVTVPPGATETESGWMFPQAAPLVRAKVRANVEKNPFYAEAEVTAMRVTSTRADEVPLTLVPAVTITLEPRQFVVLSRRPPKQLELLARVRHYGTAAAEITAGIEAPAEAGWRVSAAQKLTFAGPGDQLVKFTLTPPAQPKAGRLELRAWAKRAAGGAEFRTSVEPLPSLPTRLWSEPAVAPVHIFDMAVPEKLHIGYIAAENDSIPAALRQLGMDVTLLDEVALAFGDLGRFDAIAVGIRAYELRSDLARSNQRLLDYAAAGGTLLVQYQREGDWNRLKPAPYPAAVGQPTVRVADETVPVRFLAPENPVLNFPNKITAADFDGWVQERGLYYWSQFDAKYTPILGMNDPGERETNGGLVYARVGKGVYIYAGLSFFRQLPEGVPGAFRLFVNLLSQSKAGTVAKEPKVRD